MRGTRPRRPLPIAPAALPNLVDNFRCAACNEWVYADDARPCLKKIVAINAGEWRQCPHHVPKAKLRCDHCVTRRSAKP